MTIAELIVFLNADISPFEREMSAAARAVDDAARGMQSAGATLTAAVTLPLLAVGAAAVAAANQVDDALDTIRIKTGATGGALDALTQDFEAVARSVPSAMGDAAAAVAELHQRTDQTGAGLRALSTQVLNLSRLSGDELPALIAGTTRTFEDWAIATDRQAGALDFLWRVSQTTGAGVTSLTDKVVRFGAPLRQLGFSFEESAVLLGSFEREGVNVDLVLGSLRIGLSNFAKAGKDAPAALREVIEQIEALGPGAEATTLAIETFGARAGPDMAAAILEGRLAIDDMVARLAGSSETINRAAAETDGFAEMLQLMKNRAVLAFGTLAMPVLPVLTKWVEEASQTVEGFAGWLAQLTPATRGWMLAIAGVAAAIGPLLIVVGSLTRAVLTLRTAFIALELSMGPVGWAVAAIAVLGGLALAFNKAGDAAEDAARRASQAVDDFQAKIAAMSEMEVQVHFVADLQTRATVVRQIDAMRALIARQEAQLEAVPQGPIPREMADAARETLAALEHNRSALTALLAIERKFAARLSESSDEMRRRRDAALQMQSAMVDASSTVTTATGVEKDFGDEIRAVALALREFAVAARLGVDELPEGLRAALDRAEALQSRVDDLSGRLERLGARAPAQGFAALNALIAQLGAARAEVDRTSDSLKDRFTRGVAVDLSVQGPSGPFAAPMVTDSGLPLTEKAMRRIKEDAVAFNKEMQAGADAVLDITDSIARLADVLGAAELGDVVAGVGDIVSAIGDLQAARRDESLSGLAQVAAIGGALGGVVASIASLGAQLFGESASERERREASERLSRAMDDLRLAVEGFTFNFGTQAGILEGVNALLAQADFLANSGGGFLGRPTPVRQKNRAEDILERFGLTLAEVNAAAERLGVDLYDSAGRLMMPALEELAAKLQLSALSVEKFRDSMGGLERLLDARREIADIEDPGAELADRFRTLMEGLSEQAEVAFGLVNLDLSSAVGRDALDAALLKMIDAALAGTLDDTRVSGFESVEDFIAHLLSTDKALDAFAERANRAGASLVNTVEGFKREALRFAATAAEPAPPQPSSPGRASSKGAPGATDQDSGRVVHNGNNILHVTVPGAGDPDAVAAAVVVAFKEWSRSNPEMRAWVETLPDRSVR